jgi:hypothetical protein
MSDSKILTVIIVFPYWVILESATRKWLECHLGNEKGPPKRPFNHSVHGSCITAGSFP